MWSQNFLYFTPALSCPYFISLSVVKGQPVEPITPLLLEPSPNQTPKTYGSIGKSFLGICNAKGVFIAGLLLFLILKIQWLDGLFRNREEDFSRCFFVFLIQRLSLALAGLLLFSTGCTSCVSVINLAELSLSSPVTLSLSWSSCAWKSLILASRFFTSKRFSRC